MKWLRDATWLLVRLILSLRYRVRVHGIKQLGSLKRPVLILPNHPGYIDPPLVLSALWPATRPRPLIYEGFFFNPGYLQTPLSSPLIKFLGALLVPDLDRPSAKARAQAQQAISAITKGLRHGKNFIFWPAGHIQRDGVERLRAARALTDILQAVPEATVVLVRTRGLWGSMFGYGRTGNRPNIRDRVWSGAGWLLSNLLFFMPRRQVNITVEVLDRSQLPELRREAVNRWFEAWYNQDIKDNKDGREEPTYVPYHFLFGPRTYEFPPAAGAATTDLSRVTQKTKEEVAAILERRLGRHLTAAEQQAETTLDQLGMDSLDRMALTLDIEQRFGFSSDQAPVTLGEVWILAQGLAATAPPKPAPRAWFRPPAQDAPPAIKGDTIAEAFVARALAHPGDVAVADDQAGVVTYGRLLAGTLALSRRFSGLPAANVGLLLPASVACDSAFLALLLAGKLPVVLNWTTGPANLAHAAQTMGLTHVVTSNQFIDRTGVEVKGTHYLCLEDIRRDIGWWELLKALLTVRLLPERVRARIPKASPDQPAVVLFTSGSERAPKAVPLTHRNLLSNQRGCLCVLELTPKDCVLGFLPPFHSFGMSGTMLLPLLAGMRVVHHPDPTASGPLARKIVAYQPTILVSTPTFVGYILDQAQPGELAWLRLIVVGAEKCPESLQERCARAAPGACLLEGYGITECSPVVSVNRPAPNRPGTVGQPLPGVEVCVVDPESGAVQSTSQRGMLLVSGPTVFPGYLGYDGPSPFQQRGGKRWYITGDLVEVDGDGFIRFCGRLKRFLKRGGEMVSLPALEEPFVRRFPPSPRGPRVAVEGIEIDGDCHIVLFCTEPLDLGEANALLHEEGFRGVMRLDAVRHVDAIPVLGTGKTDYKTLREMIAASRPVEAALVHLRD